MSSTLKDIYWMDSPLAIKQRQSFDGKVGNFTIPKAHADRIRGFLDPKTEYHFFHKLKHWTLEVDGWCYELSPVQKPLKLSKFLTDACEPDWKKAEDWHESRRGCGIDIEPRKVGQTRLTHNEIKTRCDYIWKNFNCGLYLLLSANCQNFAKMLHESITISKDDPEVLAVEKSLWKKIPTPVSHDLNKLCAWNVTSGGFAASFASSAAGVAVAPAAELVTAEAGLGATATAVSTEGAGSVTAATGTGSQVTASTQAAASTQTAASTQAAASTQTATTTQATATSTSHSTFFGAGKSSVTAKGVAGSTSTGKAGLGAKLAALGHGASYGAGAGKMAMAAKVAGGVAMLHPVTGVVLLTGAGIVALGNRDQRWIKKLKNGKVPDDMSTMDMLKGEEALVDRLENPVENNDETDECIAEQLSEDLELTHVTTEPAEMPDHLIAGMQSMSVGEDAKRSNTLI